MKSLLITEIKGQVRLFINNSDYKECIDFCESVLDSFSSSNNIDSLNEKYFTWYIFTRIGECFYEMGKYEESIKAFKDSEAFVTDVDLIFNNLWYMALCHKENNNIDEAVTLLNRCVDYYYSVDEIGLVHTVRMMIGEMLQDESIIQESVNCLENILNNSHTEEVEAEYYDYLKIGYEKLKAIKRVKYLVA